MPIELLAGGGGDMGALIRSMDWSATPLGPAASWPQSLRTALGIVLESSLPMAVAWGPELRLLYNDRFRALLGPKHPQALGLPAVLDQRNVHYTPIRDESGGIAGVLAIYSEPAVPKPRGLFEPTDLAAFTGEIARTFCEAAERAGLELVIECLSLPEPIFVDRQLWEQLVRALVDAALKQTSHGRIRVSLRVEGDFAELCVRDTGRGPPVDEATHALALEVARYHAGSVDVASELGTGTTFTVRARTGRGHVVAEQLAAIFDTLGHDLRNPLNAITTSAQLLVRRATTPELARPAGRIVNSAERMARMITQLLDLTRVRATGGLMLHPRPVDLGELCQLVVGEVRITEPNANIDIATFGSPHGRFDGARIAQLIGNLVGNAVDHGEPRARIHVTVDGSEPDRVLLRVQNRGAIPHALLPILFDPFRGAEHRDEKTRGLGLGLYLAKEIVSAHRGKIAVTSTTEDGTCFEIDLPKNTEAP